MSDLNFSQPNKKTKLGESNVKFFIGKVVGYDKQKEQIEGGSGWYYKVRVLGDHGINDEIPDEQLDYVQSLLPTTGGSGAAYKLRSVRISQGDTVFGIRGGGKGGKPFILAVFPRTRNTKTASDGKFATLSGFSGTLSDTGILSGQFNDQVGPKFLKGLSGLEPGEWTKATATNPSEKVKEIHPQVKKEKNIATDGTGDTTDGTDDTTEEFKEITEEETEKNDVKNNAGKVVDPKEWKPGTPLNTATMEALKESFDKGELPPATWEAALKQASEQGLDGYEEYVIKEEIKEEVKPKILDYKQRLEEALSKGNFDAWERSVLNVDNTTIRDDGTVVPEFLLARTMNYRRDLVRKRDSLISSIEFDKRNIGQTLNDVVLITQESINESERRLEELNNEIASIEERGTIFD